MCLIECSSDQSVAGGTDMPDETIAGVLINSEGVPFSGLEVNLYREKEDTSYRVETTRSAVTDRAGRYSFSRLKPGKYKIGSFTSDSSLMHFRTGIEITETNARHELMDTLKSRARLTGRFALLFPDRTTGEMLVPGTPFAGRLDQQGRFALTLPPLQRLQVIMLGKDRTGGTVTLSREILVLDEADSLHIDSLRRIPFLAGATSVVLDNFEDGNRTHANGAVWYHYNDSSSGGTSVVHSLTEYSPGANSSASCASVEFEFGNFVENEDPFVGFAADLGLLDSLPRPAYDFSSLRGISFELQGTPHQAEVRLYSELYDESINVLEITSMPLEWTRFTIEVDAMHVYLSPSQQKQWDRIRTAVSRIDFRIRCRDCRPNTGRMNIDDVKLTFSR